jgi:DNA helicase-2/ATP-dependent DNA helicase PcrA
VDLTPTQCNAIAHKGGNLQLIACAGSGKTEVVARRVVHLLTPGDGGGLAPRNIIAFTFTDKAAAELKERIITRCREALGEVIGLAEMFVGTIHAFCLELLKTEAPKYLKYEVLNEVQQGLFVDRHCKQSGLTTSSDLVGAALKRYRDTKHYLGALSILREAEPVESALSGCSVVDGLEAYRSLLDDRSYLDYSAILEAAVEVMTNDEDLRRRLAERVRYLIVDEYQDVNPIQEAIVWLLHDLGAKVCVVGDDDQTIYQWNGSDVRNILSFAERYPDVERVALEENFRSSEGVVETARAFVEQNAERLPKAMKPAGAQDYESGDIVALSFDSPEEEARHIAETAKALRGVAIRQDADEAAVERAWQGTRLGVDLSDLKRAITNVAQAKASLSEFDQKRWGLYSIQRLFLTFLEDAGVREERAPDGRGEVVFYNLGKFSQLISDYETIHYHSKPAEKYASFADFLQYRAEDAYPEGWQNNQYANPDAVRIMTIHQAKGMQWPVVFVPALLKNRFPTKKPGGRSVWHLLPRAGIKGQPRFEGTLEDERRLFYVAMTRSQKFLHLTWAPVAGNQLFQKRSQFWDDVLASKWVKRRAPEYSMRQRLTPTPRAGVANVVFSFSDLKYFFECPYQFKLHILYGFNALDLAPPKRDLRFLGFIADASVPTRYPEDLKRMVKQYPRRTAASCLDRTRRVMKWLRCQPPLAET